MLDQLLSEIRNKSVLVVGGAQGLGLEVALRFAEAGAQVALTDGDGSETTLAEAKLRFVQAKLAEPVCLSANVTKLKDTRRVMAELAELGRDVDILIGGAHRQTVSPPLLEQTREELTGALEFNAWPIVGYLHAANKQFERYPRHAIALSTGPAPTAGRDYDAPAEAVLETFCRYMAIHLLEDNVHVNAIRVPASMETDATQGEVSAASVGDVALTLCSGLTTGMSGQVIDVGGAGFEPGPVAQEPNVANDLSGKAVIITGGTKGIGLATGLSFGKRGAQVYLTQRWGSADEDDIRSQFATIGAPEPKIVEADVSVDEDTQALLELVKADFDHVEVFVSNVAFAHVSSHHEDLTKKGMTRSVAYSSWPFVGYMQAIHKVFGTYPRYVVGMSSRGPDSYLPGYDFVAAAKAVMETMCRSLARELKGQDVRVNVIRANPVDTASLEATFGPEFVPFCRKYHSDRFFTLVEEVGETAVAVCSGLMDSIRGQVLVLDCGLSFEDNVVRLFRHRARYGLSAE